MKIEAVQSESGIAVEKTDEGIVHIRLDRPDRLNALGVDMVVALEHAIADAVAAHACVLLVRGTGRAFCAGADLKERRTMDECARVQHNRKINEAVAALAAAPMPTIAVINGLALGGGCEIALACDLRIASADALDEHARRLAAVLASRSAGGAQIAKRLVYRGLEVALDQGLAYEREALKQILASADYAEGLAAFAEKRQPHFGKGSAT